MLGYLLTPYQRFRRICFEDREQWQSKNFEEVICGLFHGFVLTFA